MADDIMPDDVIDDGYIMTVAEREAFNAPKGTAFRLVTIMDTLERFDLREEPKAVRDGVRKHIHNALRELETAKCILSPPAWEG